MIASYIAHFATVTCRSMDSCCDKYSRVCGARLALVSFASSGCVHTLMASLWMVLVDYLMYS